MLGVSRASAGQMLKRLEADGLVERGEQKEAILTDHQASSAPSGRAQAPSDRALPDGLHGLHGGGVAVHADELGDTFTDKMIERMNEKLGRRSDARTGGPSTPSGSRPRTESWWPWRSSEPASMQRSSGSPSTTATFCTGSYDEGFTRERGRGESATCGRPAEGAARRPEARSPRKRRPGCTSRRRRKARRARPLAGLTLRRSGLEDRTRGHGSGRVRPLARTLAIRSSARSSNRWSASSARACVIRPAATAAARSSLTASWRASFRPSVDLPSASATAASDLPLASCSRSSASVSPRYVAAAVSSSSR